MYIIYKHTLILDCKHAGWSYIGLTMFGDNPKKRWRTKGTGYLKKTKDNQDTAFAKAIKKYGGIEMWDINWKHEIIESNIETLEKANEREKYWIAYYHTYINDPECHGYNMTLGGDGSCGYKHTKAIKQKIKDRLKIAFPDGRNGVNHPMYGKHWTPEQLQKASEYGKAHPICYWQGKHRDEATKEKLRQANLGKKLTKAEKEKRAKKINITKELNGTTTSTWTQVIQLDKDFKFIKEWPNMSLAAKELKIPNGNITKVCQYIRNFAGGFRWIYKDEYYNKNNWKE